MDLKSRLRDFEDQFVERKLEGAGSSAFKRAMVSFANSLPPNRSGVLFVGVEDAGVVRGVSNPDTLQRKLRELAEKDCYPPIYIDLTVVNEGERTVVAAVVSYSTRKPHFAGAAFVRRGAESIEATEDLYRELLLSQDNKRRHLMEHRSATWTVDLIGKPPGETFATRDVALRTTAECRIEEVTAFYVRFYKLGSGAVFTEMLDDVHISFDDKQNRPRAVVWPTGR